jgi:ADP-heptose:LPS heptosyltransferase
MRRLAIRPGGIGDFIVSLPALEHLAAAGPLEVWTAARNVPLVRFTQARGIAGTGLDLLGITDPPARLVESLNQFDTIYCWYGANRPEFREAVSRLNLPFDFFRALPPAAHRGHAIDFYLEQVGAPAGGVPRIPCPVERQQFAAIHPFSGSPRKNWPLDKFRALARGLERIMPVYWCAGPDDPKLTDAVRIDDLYQLSCWLAQASLYIGNDSGITHLAAASGAPVLALFGPTDPAVWGPRGENVRIARWNGPTL